MSDREPPHPPAATTPYCSNCGTQTQGGDRFCRSCGASVSERTTPTAASAPPTEDRGAWGQPTPTTASAPPTEDRAAWGQPAARPDRSRLVLAKHLPIIALGFAAGVVGFVGFFLDFFTIGHSNLSSFSSGWFDLIPIFLGLSALALFAPGIWRLLSTLSLISLGIAFGVRGFVAFEGQADPRGLPGYSYGPGFWMIVLGSAVLALASWLLIAMDKAAK